MDNKNRDKRRRDIYDRYRAALGKPGLSKRIDQMREHVVRLARTICEHIWGKDFY
jgi:hypothetical protein